MSHPEHPDLGHDAHIRRRRFSLVWLIPIAAAAIAIYLGVKTAASRGPNISISFRSADGLVAGQTQIRYKAVALGTVEGIRISDDMSKVIVSARMREEAASHLTDDAAFWVVRPRVSGGNIRGLETLVSGAYIEFDPGTPKRPSQRDFIGLEQPPSVRSDEPGTTFTLEADRLGGLGVGAPVFFRDVPAGEVLAYETPGLTGPIKIHAFVREPYDHFVRARSRFWDASGANFQFGPDGAKLQLQSLQALVAGGIGFDTPPAAFNDPPASSKMVFQLYSDEATAHAALNPGRLNFVLFLQNTVRGLSPGAAVQMYGMRIGSVTGVELEYDPVGKAFRVPVHIAVQPQPLGLAAGQSDDDPVALARSLAARGLRAKLQSSNFLTGQLVVSLEFGEPPAEPAAVAGDAVVLPADAGGFDNIVNSATDFLAKLNGLPLDAIGRNLNQTLASIKEVAGSPELKQSLRSLSATLANAQDLVRRADKTMTPALARLPQIAADLQQTVQHANGVVSSIDTGYGKDSEFRRNLDRLMLQVNDTARSIRLLADFLDRHPEALVRGRAGKATER